MCKTGFKDKAYACLFNVNKFPRWLRSAAQVMVDKYQGDPRNIWAVGPENVGLIYDRFLEFDGIGDALAIMARNILVRDCGVAGGRKSQRYLTVKPDVLARRVLARAGIAESESLRDFRAALQDLKLRRPADFDPAIWDVGREFCFKTDPACSLCPLRLSCEYGLGRQGAPRRRPTSVLVQRARG
jgi:endonuclease III